MKQQTSAILVASAFLALVASVRAQDYDAPETEAAITGLTGLGSLGGLGGLSSLGSVHLMANGAMSAGLGPNQDDNTETIIQNVGDGGMGASESSDADSGDYDDDSNDSAASEEHPILAKFMSLLGRHKRSVDQAEAPIAAPSQTLSRVKRGYKGWVPYVSTYVKTDKKANFKWGVKAKVGKKYGK